jgi:hypothetical protein
LSAHAACSKEKVTAARREAMGGLAKGLAVIRVLARALAADIEEIAARAGCRATARRCILTLED